MLLRRREGAAPLIRQAGNHPDNDIREACAIKYPIPFLSLFYYSTTILPELNHLGASGLLPVAYIQYILSASLSISHELKFSLRKAPPIPIRYS